MASGAGMNIPLCDERWRKSEFYTNEHFHELQGLPVPMAPVLEGHIDWKYKDMDNIYIHDSTRDTRAKLYTWMCCDENGQTHLCYTLEWRGPDYR
jgi:hypothetical protein